MFIDGFEEKKLWFTASERKLFLREKYLKRLV